MHAIVWWFEHSLALPFFGIGMKTDLFQSCGHCWVFQICWHIECSTLRASSFRSWNSSAGIPSPPLALFEVLLPMATKHGQTLREVAVMFGKGKQESKRESDWEQEHIQDKMREGEFWTYIQNSRKVHNIIPQHTRVFNHFMAYLDWKSIIRFVVGMSRNSDAELVIHLVLHFIA